MMPAITESERNEHAHYYSRGSSRFLDSKKFLSLMMYMLRNSRVSDSVYQIIESDIDKDWNLEDGSQLFMS